MGTRIALYYILAFFLLLFGTGVALAFFTDPEEFQAILAGKEPVGVGLMLVIEAFLAPALVVTTIGFVRLIDRKPLFEIGALWPPDRRHLALRQVALAAAGAAATLGAWMTLASLGVRFQLDASGNAEGLAQSALEPALFALGFLAAACLEEWILRGYIFSTLREQLSWVHAAGIAALLFVLPGLLSAEIAAAGLVNTFLLGLVLGAVRELTGSLWPGIFFHATWNSVLGSVLSLPISGTVVPRFFALTAEGSDAWTGGDYGPEGSWLMSFLLVIALVVLAGILSRDEVPDEDDEDDEDEDDEIGFF